MVSKQRTTVSTRLKQNGRKPHTAMPQGLTHPYSRLIPPQQMAIRNTNSMPASARPPVLSAGPPPSAALSSAAPAPAGFCFRCGISGERLLRRRVADSISGNHQQLPGLQPPNLTSTVCYFLWGHRSQCWNGLALDFSVRQVSWRCAPRIVRSLQTAIWHAISISTFFVSPY
jgi:hypothetical protein